MKSINTGQRSCRPHTVGLEVGGGASDVFAGQERMARGGAAGILPGQERLAKREAVVIPAGQAHVWHPRGRLRRRRSDGTTAVAGGC